MDAALALGSGEERLKWAMKEVERRIKAAEARARNPVNKIRSINIALFGFSRGAALARAFALRINDKCGRPAGRGGRWQGKYPTRLYFMGLFDTVASVGANAMLRKYSREAATVSAVSPLLGALAVQVAGNADGHMGWAGNLRIPAMVEQCVHYCAAHEIRNSFPLDTVLEEGKYPANCPMRVPTTMLISMAATPTASETRPPARFCASRSRPKLSVPNGCSTDGAWLRARTFVVLGSTV